jgi:putative transposase
MKMTYQHIGLVKLCGWFGMTRQSYYQHNWTSIETTFEQELVLKQIKEIRKRHPKMGGRKLYTMLEPFLLFHHIKIGRDGLFDLLATNNLLIKRRKRRIQTTYSNHWLRKYPNLTREFVPTSSHQLWVSDITYWKANEEDNFYISFITDAYSHKIVGYDVAETLEAAGSVRSLEKALVAFGEAKSLPQLVHHSDRGVQYCSKKYVKLLQDRDIGISMTENGDPLENAIAERVNGILKGEYLECYSVKNIQEAQVLLSQVVELYNNERPHMSIGNKTPNEIHQSNQKTEKLWKNYWSKKRNIVNVLQD